MWGRDSPDTPGKPHKCTIETKPKKPCTIDRKFWFSDSGGCTIVVRISTKTEEELVLKDED